MPLTGTVSTVHAVIAKSAIARVPTMMAWPLHCRAAVARRVASVAGGIPPHQSDSALHCVVCVWGGGGGGVRCVLMGRCMGAHVCASVDGWVHACMCLWGGGEIGEVCAACDCSGSVP